MRGFDSFWWSEGGLGELPAIASAPITASTAAQYAALDAGTTVGGNWEEYLDAVDQGFFAKSPAGYGQFLAYNSGGLNPALYQTDPHYLAWKLASLYAGATARGQHTGNNLSPVYTPELAQQQLVRSVAGLAGALKLTPDAAAALLADASDTLNRLLVKWGQHAPASTATLPTPAPSPAAAAPAPAPVTRKIVQIVAARTTDLGAPGDGIHFPVKAYRLATQRQVGSGSWQYDSFGPWSRWDGVINRTSSDTTAVAFLEDIRGEIAQADAVHDTRPRDYWNWPALQATLAGPVGPPPPTSSNQVPGLAPVDVLAAPSSSSSSPATLPAGAPAPAKPPVINAPTPSGQEPAPPPPPAVQPPAGVPGSPVLPIGPTSDIAVPPPAAGGPPIITITGDNAGGPSLETAAEPAAGEAPPAPSSGTPWLWLGLAGVGLYAVSSKRRRRR